MNLTETRPATPAAYSHATSKERLLEAWAIVASRKGSYGVDGLSIDAFGKDLHGQLFYLATELSTHTYAPMPLRRTPLPKLGGGVRWLGIPTVRDRVVQQALLLALQPKAEATFLDASYGYRVDRNAHMALRAVERCRAEGYRWVVNADIRKCFDSLRHEIVLQRVRNICEDDDVLDLIRAWMRVKSVDKDGIERHPVRGVPQGAPISPLLTNLYLHPLDVFMTQSAAIRWIRYADDFLCLTRSRADAYRVRRALTQFVERHLGLELKAEKSGITTFDAGFEFLGFAFKGESKSIAPQRTVDIRKRILWDSTRADLRRAMRLQRVHDRILGFGAYYRAPDPLVIDQLQELDDWAQPTLQEVFMLTDDERRKLPSFLWAPQHARPPSRNGGYYLELLDLAAEIDESPPVSQRRPTTSATRPGPEVVRMPVSARGITPLPPRPASNGEPRARLDGGDAGIFRTHDLETRSVPVVTLPPAPAHLEMLLPRAPVTLPTIDAASQSRRTEDVAGREETDAAVAVPEESADQIAALFLGEGYPKEELRDFLRLSKLDPPLRANDGTVFIDLHGCSLAKLSQQLVIRRGRDELAHFALRDVTHLVIQGIGVSVSSTLLRELAVQAIPVHFLDWRGAPFGTFFAPAKESPTILRGQLRAFEGGLGVAIAREMLAAKAKNQIELLRLYERYRRKVDRSAALALVEAIEVMERNLNVFDTIDGERVDAIRGRLLAVEGRIAAAHFRAIARLVGPEHGFTARTRHGEDFDPINSLLDYSYGLLYTRCHRALVLAGLDPRIGFVHTDGPNGKLSLVYDFVEEFRALGADRPVLALVTRGIEVRRLKNGMLTIPVRRKLVRAFIRNLGARCRYRADRRALAEIIDAQARHLADVLVAKRRKVYRGFRYNH